jgi:hypothetical protein
MHWTVLLLTCRVAIFDELAAAACFQIIAAPAASGAIALIGIIFLNGDKGAIDTATTTRHHIIPD